MPSVSTLFKVIKSKSPKYMLFRSKYEFERKTGVLANKFPKHPKQVKLPSLSEWRQSSTHYILDSRNDELNNLFSGTFDSSEIEHVKKGDVRFFSHKWIELGLDYDWVTNPDTGYKYDVKVHWTKVADYNKDAGDIKYVWEPSRFSFIYPVVRHDYFTNEDHSKWCFERILNWIDGNPLNCGPNYKCSQEISLRVFNWLFALYFYKDSPSLNEDVWSRIINSIYWQIHHVYQNIDFSRISVRNNHAITETLALYVVGLLFPMFPNAAKWKKCGKKWFEQEIEYQFESDGTYLQNSMNYQRVVTQLLTIAISVSNKNNEKFNKVVYDRAYANVDFLFQCLDDKTGVLPNYGANDGALFFQWHGQDYCDYSFQIRDLESLLMPLGYKPLSKKSGLVVFSKSGYFIIREDDSFTFVRCGGYKGKHPADQLHIDIWSDGENILMDSGTYKYNTDDKTIKYFFGTESHNSVMLGNNDQMLKGPRFMWFYPLSIQSAKAYETEDSYVIECSINAYKQLSPNIFLSRRIIKKKGYNQWTISDTVSGKPDNIPLRQIWHTLSESISISSDVEVKELRGHYSRYYGSAEENRQIEFITNKETITTEISLSR